MKVSPSEVSVRIRRLVTPDSAEAIGLESAIAAAIAARIGGAGATNAPRRTKVNDIAETVADSAATAVAQAGGTSHARR